MAKRRAATDLNRDNWDKEDEPEDPGTFQVATPEGLKNRIIRKAKRSLGNVIFFSLHLKLIIYVQMHFCA